MDSRDSLPPTSSWSLPTNVGDSLLADGEITSFLPRQNSQSFTNDSLELSEFRQDMLAFDGNCSPSNGRGSSETDSVPAGAVNLTTDDNYVKAGVKGTSWTMEIVALLIAASSLISVYSILGSLDNKEQPHWPLPSTLNLGALIALLATILRSMIMVVLESVISQLKWRWFKSARPLSHLEAYDGASRGPLGAAMFIPLYRFNWATLGAFISGLSIAIGTLTQQAFQTSDCSRPVSHGDAFIPIAQTSLGTVRGSVFNDNNPGGSAYLDPRLKAALISGLAGTQLTRPLTPTCSSGNCTFVAQHGITHSSLIIATECIDVSPLVAQSETEYWDGNLDTRAFDEAPLAKTRYSSPFGTYLNYDGQLSWLSLLSAQVWRGVAYENYGVKLSGEQRTIAKQAWAEIALMMPTSNPCEDASKYQPYIDSRPSNSDLPSVNTSSCAQLELPKVASLPGFFSVISAICWLYPSLQHFTGSIEHGSFQEQAVGDSIPLTSSLKVFDNTTGEFVDDVLWSSFADPCIIDGSIYVPDNFTKAPGGLFTVTGVGDSSVNITWPRRCFYGLGSAWSEVNYPAQFSHTFSQPDQFMTCLPSQDYTEMRCTDKWWLNDIYNGGNASTESITKMLSRGFASMSDQMRMMGSDWQNNPSNVSGTVHETSICIKFYWQWLFFPLALVLGTLLLLIAVMVDTRREVIWKSSVLPLLFYGLEERQTMDESRLCGEKELHATAKTRMVDFSFAKGAGWRFRGATETRL